MLLKNPCATITIYFKINTVSIISTSSSCLPPFSDSMQTIVARDIKTYVSSLLDTCKKAFCLHAYHAWGVCAPIAVESHVLWEHQTCRASLVVAEIMETISVALGKPPGSPDKRPPQTEYLIALCFPALPSAQTAALLPTWIFPSPLSSPLIDVIYRECGNRISKWVSSSSTCSSQEMLTTKPYLFQFHSQVLTTPSQRLFASTQTRSEWWSFLSGIL